MKPLHAGLLLAGAILAAGIAFKMTQPPVVPAAAPAVPTTVSAPTPKPSPMPLTRPVRTLPTLKAAAPEPVYDEPPKPAIRKNEAKLQQPGNRKNEPILQARMKPMQWIPGKYESTADAVPAKATPAPVTRAAVEQSAVTPVTPAVEKAALPPLHQATLRLGISIAIRLSESLSSDYSRAGGTFAGSLIEPLIADGFVIAERGAPVTGRIVDSQKAGRFGGMSRMELGLTNVMTSDGQKVVISTDPWTALSDSVPSQTVIRFRVNSQVTITEQRVTAQ